jgi:hypothetical protein
LSRHGIGGEPSLATGFTGASMILIRSKSRMLMVIVRIILIILIVLIVLIVLIIGLPEQE